MWTLAYTLKAKVIHGNRGWKPWQPLATTSRVRPQGHESQHQNYPPILIILRAWFSLGFFIHTGMYLQPLPDYTVHVGDEAAKPARGEEALGGKEM